MAIACYLAMTAAEFSACACLPPHIGWLACHFSSSGPGLSNLPKALPPDSVLILDDSTPFHDHNADVILGQLQEAADTMQLRAILLDFQRAKKPEVQDLVAVLQKELSRPVAAPPEYALKDYPVFVAPCPLNRPLKKHLAPYMGRSLWLDVSPLPAKITLTPRGSHYEALKEISNMPHWEPTLHCHYNIHIEDERIVFNLIRDLESWLQEAEALGVTAGIGLYQEFKK